MTKNGLSLLKFALVLGIAGTALSFGAGTQEAEAQGFGSARENMPGGVENRPGGMDEKMPATRGIRPPAAAAPPAPPAAAAPAPVVTAPVPAPQPPAASAKPVPPPATTAPPAAEPPKTR